ncbi:MAG: dockerin type I repeat-containing protein, partial [Muribaculaceae bacterium]|nr:dockerin type I repeat-containing protein [Muribaculaceae bacterium]
DTDGFVPFFNWRIGIQFHYTVDGVKNSTGITYIEVYEKPNDVQPGDANGDNEITIADVSTLIDMLLDDAEYFEGADVNGDGFVTIADVSALIDMLLEN